MKDTICTNFPACLKNLINHNLKENSVL